MLLIIAIKQKPHYNKVCVRIIHGEPQINFFLKMSKISGEIRHNCGESQGHNPAKIPHIKRKAKQKKTQQEKQGPVTEQYFWENKWENFRTQIFIVNMYFYIFSLEQKPSYIVQVLKYVWNRNYSFKDHI